MAYEREGLITVSGPNGVSVAQAEYVTDVLNGGLPQGARADYSKRTLDPGHYDVVVTAPGEAYATAATFVADWLRNTVKH